MYRLCLKLGYAHPDFLLQKLSSSQISGWLEYFNLEPFGPLYDAHFAGTVASAVYNSKRTKKSSGKACVPSDFFPFLKRPQTLKEQEESVMAWAKLYEQPKDEKALALFKNKSDTWERR